MPFLALNAVEDDIRENQEKHTLEFQFEDALKLYEAALQKHRDGGPEAKTMFVDLLQFPLFDFNRYKNVPPSAFRLKSLALKNYSILMLEDLKEYTDPKLAFEVLRPVIGYLLEALTLSNDPAVIEILCALAKYLNYPKLARVALEELVSDSTNRALSAAEALASENSKLLLGPKDEDMLARLRNLVKSVGDDSQIPEFNEYPAFRRDYSWLSKLKFPTSLLDLLDELRDNSISVSVPKRDISVLATSIESALSNAVKKRKKDSGDVYMYSEKPVNSVNFVAPHGEALDFEAEQPEVVDLDTQEPVPTLAKHTRVDESHVEIVDLCFSEPESSTGAPLETTTTTSAPADPATAATPSAPTNLPSRQSARNKSPEFGISLELGANDQGFIAHLCSFLAVVDLKYQNVLPAYDNTPLPEQRYLSDFKHLLEKWDDDAAQHFLNSGPPEVDASQPVMQMLDFAAMRNQKTTKPGKALQGSSLVDDLLEKLKNNSHIQQVRFQLFCGVLSGSPTLVHSTALTPAFMDIIASHIEAFGAQILELCRDGQLVEEQISQVAMSTFEFHLDQYLSFEQELRKRQLQQQQQDTQQPQKLSQSRRKAQAAEEAERKLLRGAVEQWMGAAGDCLACTSASSVELALRYKWAQIFYTQSQGDDPEETIAKFQEFQQLAPRETRFEYANFQAIPTASVESAETQISKYRAASIFSKVFLPQETDEDIRNTISLLEPMLMPEVYSMDLLEEAESIAQFLKTSSLDFRLNLWYLLLDSYEKIGEAKKSLEGLVKILKSSIDECKGARFARKPPQERSYTLLQCLSVANDISKRLFPLVRDNSTLLDQTQSREMLKYIIWLCELLHVFTLTDQAINQNMIKAPNHQSWENTVKKFRELDIRCWCLFYYFYRSSLPEEKRTNEVLNDILSIIHEQLGHLSYCGFADGMLLKLHIDEILRLNWPESEADLLQCLNCLYGISLANETFTRYSHHAIPVELTRQDALNLTKFIMRMILNKKNLPQVIQRQNVRQVLDTFHNAIGAPDTQIQQIARNEAILETFIEQTPTTAVMSQCLKGSFRLSLSQSHDPTFSLVGAGGFYYVMALVHLNLYRIKRRTNPEKVDDLHHAIKFFKYDLTYATNRFESWMGLSQVYDHLCENSLLFVSPEIQKAEGIASDFQSKALMCACMAASVLHGSDPSSALSVDYFHTLREGFYAHLGKILYYSAVEPLAMAIYNAAPSSRFVYVDEKYEVTTALIDRKLILKLALRYLNAACERPGDWFSLALKSEVLRELDRDVHEIMDTVIKSSRVCAQAPAREVKGGLDATFETMQLIISSAWGFYIQDKITGQELLEYLKNTSFPYDVPSNYTSEEVAKAVIQVISGLTSADKKHWLHYPRYMLASIYETKLNDTQKAQQEMELIISVKSTTKPLATIWKPDYERPGQHFDFCRDYIIYYSDLLLRNKDDAQMGLLVRRVRKYTAVANHVKVWNHVLNNAVTLAKDLVGFPRKYTERVVPALVPEMFEKRTAELEKWMQEQILSVSAATSGTTSIDPWVLALDYAQDLKKLNIGLGSTVPIDELVIAFYMALYTTFKPMEDTKLSPEPAASAGSIAGPAEIASGETGSITTTPFAETAATTADKKKSRITRKDILARAAQALKPISSKLYSKTDVRGMPKSLYGKGQDLVLKEEAANLQQWEFVPMEVLPSALNPDSTSG